MIPRNRAIVWAAASFLLLARQHAHAQFSLGKGVGKSAAKTEKALPYRPPFSEVPFLLENAPANNPLAPPSFVQAPQYAFPGHEKRPGVSTIEGQMLYDLNDPPKTHYWWNVPLYALTGFPRDGIDWLFGVIGYVPAANLVATGAYEFSGAQFLMRSPDDVHGYGGAANANKHGWREGEGWGFFSIYRHTRFREVDQNLLAQWKKHNEQVEASLDQRNSQVTQYNATVENIRKAYCDKAIEDWKAGRYNDALGRLWSYCPQRPNDYPALACYIACCIQQASSGTKDAQWGEVETQRLLRDWQAGNLPLLIDTLRTDAGRRLNDLEVRYWLTWAYAEMGSHAEALKEARELSENPRTGLRGNLLYFEICAQRFQELDPSKKKEAESAADLLDRMQSAVVRMRVADQAGGASAAEPKSPETRLAEARLMILNGRYDEGTAALKALAQDQFGEAKYSYYYAAALLRQGLLTPTYQKQEALGALRHAQALARGPERAAVIAQAIEEADKVKPPAAQRAADLAE